MSIETAIQELTEAVKANTAALLASGVKPEIKIEEPKVKKKAKPEPVEQATPAPEPETAPDPKALILKITETVKGKLLEADDKAAFKKKWEDVRAKFGVDKINELEDQPEKLLEALEAAKQL